MTETITRRVISHSEVESHNQCEVKHHYAHELKITPIAHSDALGLGTCGHLFIETFLKAILDGESNDNAKQEAMLMVASEPYGPRAITLCVPWVDEIYPNLGWKILAVEQEFRIAISETLVYACKVDAIVEINGDIVLVDHKFVYDPYDQAVIDLMPQLPKYMGAMRNNGVPVKYALYNMIRTRNTTKDLYTIKPTYPNNHRIKTAMLEQIEVMKRIEAGTPMPIHTANKMNCGNCQFKDLCAMELRGEDSTLFRENFFKPNTYGYEDI